MKTVVITGASKGIGAACAEEFAKAGYNVVANYNTSKQEAVLLRDKLISDNYSVSIKQADVSIFEQAAKLIDFAVDTYGKIDVLVNNAGICHYGLLSDTSPYIWNKVMSSNVDSVYNCSRLAVSNMLKRHEGKIINISSIWGIQGASCEVAYSTSKAAIIGFTKALALELAPSGINVNCVAPGVVDTAMISNLNNSERIELEQNIPLGYFASVDDIAKVVMFLASDSSKYITGEVVKVAGGA